MSIRRKFLIYNPENDIALGYGKANFTPPKNAALLARYAAPIMWWMGGSGDEVLVEGLDEEDYRLELIKWRERMAQLTGNEGPEFVRHFTKKGVCMPWGWSRYAARRCRVVGGDRIPDEKTLDKIRELSHRRSSIMIAEWIRERVDFRRYGLPEPEVPVECHSQEDVTEALGKWGTIYLKAPWSSSGRGVVRVNAGEIGRYTDRVEGTIRNQGVIMAEKGYEKDMDFAMLFKSGEGRVKHIGYSVFRNSNGNAYSGNLLGSDERLKGLVAEKVGALVLDEIEHHLEECLTAMLWEYGCEKGLYEGYMGVDMMVTKKDNGRCGIVPFVELNLRMTMGVIAHEVYRKIGEMFRGEEWTMEMEYIGGKEPSDDGIDVIPRNKWFAIKVK